MNVFFFFKGRSERSRKNFLYKLLTFVVRLLDAFFGTYSWQLPAAEAGFSGRVPTASFAPEQSLNKVYYFARQVIGSTKGNIQILKNEIQFKRPLSKWGAIKTRSALLKRIYLMFTQWREAIGRRGPPRALFAGIDTVRMQE